MHIKKIKINNYRNYNEAEISFHEKMNILYGDNAQGKTNILESIYICATTKSHQGSKDKEIIKMGCDEAHVKMYIEKEGLEHYIDLHLKKNKPKGIAVNGIPIKRSAELMGIINIVLFSPEDLNIIKNGPSERRRFIDMELCQLSRIYLDNLYRYSKVLNQRNHLLKQISYNESLKETLSVWDEQLIKYGTEIIKERKEFIEQINNISAEIHKKLTGEKEFLNIQYEPNVDAEEFADKLYKNYNRDIYYQITHTGPHRDDIKFISNDMDLRTYRSQGQKRTAALSLKLSEIEIVKKKTGDIPVLLLDDVLSELDRSRQNYLLESIDDVQTIITCTGLEEFINHSLDVNRIYKIENGNVTDIEMR